VTAWLPLAMDHRSGSAEVAFFLVCLGAFYPILINTIFGVRSVDPRCSRRRACSAAPARRSSSRWCCRRACGDLHRAAARPRLRLGVIVVGEMTGVQTGLGAIIMEARQLFAPRS